MISKSNKFPMRAEFFAFRKRAKVIHTPHLLLYYAAASQAKPTGRSGVIVPKKVNKLATGRNSIRRTLLDALLPLATSTKMDVVIFVKSSASLSQYIAELVNV